MPQKLTFKIGEESRPAVLSIDEAKSSPFCDAINLGTSKLRTAITNIMNDKGHNIDNEDSNTEIDKYSRCNIIAFLGERGTGKTSCLCTVMEQIRTDANPQENGSRLSESVMCMPIVEPSFFDNTHNILDIFIGELYNKYLKECNDYCSLDAESRNKLKKLQTKFKDAKQAIYFLNGRALNKPIDELEELGRLSDGVNLRRIMCELVDSYLDFAGKKCLIVGIDDLDINIRQAYDMMEQIRKYLLLPNMVILLAAKYEQLRQSICLALAKHFDILFDKQNTTAEIGDMAERYLEKFIPTDRRVYMPTSEVIMKAGLTIADGNNPEEEFSSVEFAVLSLIFRKTRYLFYNHDGETSLIVPRNLRELRNLITLLIRMQQPNDENPGIHQLNKRQFKQYMHEQWLQTLTPEQQKIARIILAESSISKLNKLVISHIHDYISKKNTGTWLSAEGDSSGTSGITDSSRRILKEIVDGANNPTNVSVGDVMFFLNLIRKFEDSEESRRLLFFIRTHYSMLLYELYDDMTSSDNLDDSGIKSEEQTGTSIPVLRNANNTGSIPQYFDLVGGSFFTLSGSTFISHTGSPRELIKINGRLLAQEIRSIIEEYNNLKQAGSTPNETLTQRLRLVEFFILGSRRNLFTKSLHYSPEASDGWRKDVNACRFAPFNNAKNILFDVTAPFVNMIYPRFAYDRFNKDLYEIALEWPDSLLNRILDIQRYADRSRFANLMSQVAMRNLEVLDDLHLWLADKRTSLRPGDWNEIGALCEFYKLFDDKGAYKVKTYDIDSANGQFHTITFRPIAKMADILEDVKSSTELKKTFDNIINASVFLLHNEKYPTNELRTLMSRIQAQDSPWLITELQSIVGTQEEITSETLVRNLVQYPVLDKKTVTEILDDQLIQLYKDEYTQHQKSELNIRKNRLDKATASWQQLSDRLNKLQKEDDDITSQLKKLDSNIITLDEEDAKLQNLHNHEISACNSRRTQIEEKTAEQESLEKQRNEVEKIDRRLSVDIQSLQARIDDIDKQIGNKGAATDSLAPMVLTLSLRRPNLVKELESFESNHQANVQLLTTLTKQISECESDIQRLKAENKSSEPSIQMISRQRRLYALQKKNIERNRTILIQRLQSLSKIIGECRIDISKAQSELNEAKEAHDKVRRSYRSNLIRLNRI